MLDIKIREQIKFLIINVKLQHGLHTVIQKQHNLKLISIYLSISLRTSFRTHHQAWFLLLDTFYADRMSGWYQMASLPTNFQLCCSGRQSWSKCVSSPFSSKYSHTSPVHSLCTSCPPIAFGLDEDTPMKLKLILI